MKTLTYTFAGLLISIASQAQFVDIGIPNASKIKDAQYYCGDNKGAFVIRTKNPATVWQTELDQNGSAVDGLEIKVTEIRSARCPHCFTLKGNMAVGTADKLYYTFNLDGSNGSAPIKLVTVMTDSNGQKFNAPDMTCTFKAN